jgi:hypothetical protein
LAIITYNKKYDYIKKNLEPWFHGISIFFPLVFSVILLATNTYNGPEGGNCTVVPYDPPHCIGYKAGEIPEGYSIPCGRGGADDSHAELRTIALSVVAFTRLIITPLIILVTMVRMFRSITKIEKQIQKYGVSALRGLRRTRTPAAPTNNDNSIHQHEASYFANKFRKLRKCLCLLMTDTSQRNHRFPILFFLCPCAGEAGCDDPESRQLRRTKSNQMASQKRAVLYMAYGYAGAWLLTWSAHFVSIIIFFAKSYPPDIALIFMSWMAPLQGFFNFLVFMAPKVRTTRTLAMRWARTDSSDNNNQNQQHLTWCQAFYRAYMDRGRRLEDRNMRSNNRTERRIATAIVKKINEAFPVFFKRIKSVTSSAIRRTSSPEFTETNEECLESGKSAAAASSP